jgi:hypothetical protein
MPREETDQGSKAEFPEYEECDASENRRERECGQSSGNDRIRVLLPHDVDYLCGHDIKKGLTTKGF